MSGYDTQEQSRVASMYYSQFGEDKILNELFHGKLDGCCVEVGANNGVNDSNTLFFEELGWRCLLVEPNPDLCKEIRAKRTSELFECAVSDKPGEATLYIAEGAERAHGVSTISSNDEVHERIKNYGFQTRPVKVRVRTLDDIFEAARINAIDFISIDVEGLELEVLLGLSLKRWMPEVLLIEDNSDYRDHAVSSYLRSQGYIKFNRTGVNDWYAHASNSRLVNPRSKARIMLISANKKLNHFMQPIKHIAKKVPFIVKLYENLRGRS